MSKRWIDGHLDLAWIALEGRDLHLPRPDKLGGVSLPDLQSAGVDLCFATIFTAPDEDGPAGYRSPEDAHVAGIKQLTYYRKAADAGSIRLVTRADDPLLADQAAPGSAPPPGLGALLLMENADPIRTPEEAAFWWQAGVRIVGLAWAPGSRYAGGNAGKEGLSSAGRPLLAEFDRLGMIHDASHLSDAAFADLLSLSAGPVIASHSNCRAIAGPTQRHLTDEQIAAIAAREGVIGLNLFSAFLVDPARKDAGASIDDCLRHIAHVEDVTGNRRHIALGSDMDGGFPPSRLPEGIRRPQDFHRLTDALAKRDWSDEDLSGFAGENWRRFLRERLPGG